MKATTATTGRALSTRGKVQQLADHPSTSEGERQAAQAALDRLDSKPRRKRHITPKLVLARCQFPDPYKDEWGEGHLYSYLQTTRRRKFCPEHYEGWVHQFKDEDGDILFEAKRGDNRRARLNDDGSYSLIVEEVHTDAEVFRMLDGSFYDRQAEWDGVTSAARPALGRSQVGEDGIVSTRVDPKLYRALKVKGTREVHPVGFSLDEDRDGRDMAELGDLLPLTDPQAPVADLIDPSLVPAAEVGELLIRRNAPTAVAFGRLMQFVPGTLSELLQVVIPGWRDDPIATANAYKAAAIAHEHIAALEAKAGRVTPVLNSEAPRLDDSTRQENQ